MSDAKGLLGLASSGRKISTGETVFHSIRKNQAKLVIIGDDLGNNTRKKLVDKCTFYKIPYVFYESSKLLGEAIGDYNKKYVAILDEGFAKKLEICLKG
ncbi:MAG: ribosomal L7Ae/L30e/S12e/Gadd45 family protein [Erysipelotrichaceae bacterium]|uniref:L7Ae/L30e/S12e/Gadd45 family ribosomal protein n=1 Tax=Anaerorhabdus sp. TaxID=1872524 RepID=UPI002FC8956C